ncbi:MAG TPA: D-glycero-beta-D-manno-heptose-7-phosphate kinase [Vicinamibacterales bacterium]|nr:D-glycero-beta-D-manno-heptose-7-phosphate kinase [Vicinamibacterales bacterium]
MRRGVPPLSAERARTIVHDMARARVMVLGDVMLDQFTIGRVTRISPEAPVPVVAFERDEFRAGGAANVALNVRALGADVDLIGLVGPDQAASRLRELMSVAGIHASGLITDEKRRTTTKVRIVTTRNQQVARVDYESEEAAAEQVEDALIDQLHDRITRAGAVIVSDYLKGLVTRRLMTAVIAAARAQGVPVLVDPKIPHLDHYAGATIVTPNHHEAEVATHLRIRTDEDVEQAAAIFRERARCHGVLITRGEQGMWLACDGVEGHLPATAREVSDVTGAGDTVVATLALAIAAGATMAEAARIANEAAGIVVAKFGPATVSPAELIAPL